MQIDLGALPDDTGQLQQLLRDVVAVTTELHVENDQLRLSIQRLLRQRFGRRSEQLSDEQLQLALEDIEQDAAENQARQEAAGQQPARRAAQPSRNCRRTCRATKW
jgi:hypothetical protein